MDFEELMARLDDVSLAFNLHLILRGLRVGVIIDRVTTYFAPDTFDIAIDIAKTSSARDMLQYVLSKDEQSLLIYNTSTPDVFSDDVLKQAFQMPAGVVYSSLQSELCSPEKTTTNWWWRKSPPKCNHFTLSGVLFYQEKCAGEMSEKWVEKWVEEGKRVGGDVVVQPCNEVSDAKFYDIINNADTVTLFVRRFDVAKKFWGESMWQLTGWIISNRCVNLETTRALYEKFGVIWRFVLWVIKMNSYALSPNLRVTQVRKCRNLIGDLERKLYDSGGDLKIMKSSWYKMHLRICSACQGV